MKTLFRLSIVVLAVVLVACGSPATDNAAESETVSLTLALSYIPDIQFAPFYVAAERGYFADEGIDITFETVFENESIPLVGAGELRYAVASAEQVLLARAQGLPVVYVAKWWQDYPVAVAVKTDSGIASPADLAGREIGLPGLYGASYIGLRALMATAGLSESDVTLTAIDFTQVPSLANDTVEAVVVYANNEPLQLESQGYDVTVLRVADYANLASNGLVTSEAEIAEHPDVVAAMIRAMLRGLADTIADPDAAYEISLGYVETLASADETLQKQVLAASIAMWQSDTPGLSDPAAWANTQDVLLMMGLLNEPLELDAVYTNAFIE